jgi:hypothetical protein
MLAAVVIASGWIGGCESTRSDRGGGPGWTIGRSSNVSDGGLASDAVWAIALASYDRAGHERAAKQQSQRFSRQTGMTGFWAHTERARSTVYFGRYESADSHEAQQDLSRLRAVAGRRGFAPMTMALAPVLVGGGGGASPFDLRQVATNPEAIYTLQVAVYDEVQGPDFRRVAERHAAELRQQGHEAYFYHGPRQSLVTVGVFYHGAIHVIQDGPRRGQSEYHRYIREQLQGEFPHMLVNGQKQPLDATGRKLAPTILVRVPR